jgi:hypothetical protein
MADTKFVFAVGIAQLRTVTVRARSLCDARLKALDELDKRASKESGATRRVGSLTSQGGEGALT